MADSRCIKNRGQSSGVLMIIIKDLVYLRKLINRFIFPGQSQHKVYHHPAMIAVCSDSIQEIQEVKRDGHHVTNIRNCYIRCAGSCIALGLQ